MPIRVQMTIVKEDFEAQGHVGFFETAHQYRVQIRGENKFGESQYSFVSHVFNGAGFTLNAPDPVTALVRNWNPTDNLPTKTAIKLKWTAPVSFGGEINTASTVEYQVY